MMLLRSVALAAATFLSLIPGVVAAQMVMPATNPFGQFQSYRLANGLRVWYGHLSGATVTSMAIVVPVGFDSDPPGREQRAHLLEHVLLSDRSGMSEAELVRALAGRGGTYAGATYADRTTFTLSIGTAEAAYGVQWLYSVVAARPLTDALIGRNRAPAAIEIGARPRALHDHIIARYINHPALRPAGFWEREFGLQTAAARNVDAHAALHATGAAELNAFFEASYTPAAMTLVIVSGAPRALLQPAIDETFGTLPWRPAPAAGQLAAPRRGESRHFGWSPAATTTIRLGYRLAAFDARDHLRALLLAALLERRLMERLRRGDAKIVYAVNADVITRGTAGALLVTASIDPAHERAVRDVFEHEIGRLRNAVADSSAFYADRDAVARALRNAAASTDALRAFATERFIPAGVHADFPDFAGYVSTAGADSIAAFAQRLLTTDNRMLHLRRPLPDPLLLSVLAALILLLAVRTWRALVLVPADMSRIRFMARLHPRAGALRTIACAILALLAARLAVAGAHLAAGNWLLTFDAPVLHAAAAAGFLFGLAIAALAAAGAVPHKVLVFDDEVRLKSRTYRAVVLPRGSLVAARLEAGHGLTLDRRPLPRAVSLHATDGRTWHLSVRDPHALHAALLPLCRTADGADPAFPAAVASEASIPLPR